MRAHERFLIGGVGALAPILLFFATADSERIFSQHIETFKLLGYLVRASALFVIGGFVAFLHKDEKSPVRILEFGIAAPALIAGFISTSSASVAPAPVSPRASLDIGWVAAAYADTAVAGHSPASVETKQYSPPSQTSTEQFFQGLIGTAPKNVWYVIAGSHLKLDDARKQAAQLNHRFPGFKADVYAPSGPSNPYYAVVIGAHLTQADARALRDKAVKAGLPKDTYYKIPEQFASANKK